MDQDTLQQMIDAGLAPQRMDLLAQQIKRAQGLMATPGAEGTRVGGTYVSASPLEHFAGAMARVMGGQQMKKAQGEQGSLIDQIRSARLAASQGMQPQEAPPVAPVQTQPEQPHIPPLLARAPDAWAPPNFAPESPASLPAPVAGAPSTAQAAPKTTPKLSWNAAAQLSGDPAIMAAGKAQTDEAVRQSGLTMKGAEMDLERRRLDEALAQHQANVAHQNASLEETKRHNLASERTQSALVGGGGALSGDALDMAATLYAQTGQLPSLGRSPAGRTAIITRAAELFPGTNVAGNKATLHADQSSLAGLQKQVDTVNAFERTALANLDRFEQEAGKTVDFGSPIANRPGRWLASNAGDPQVARFTVARQVAVNEIGKILSGSMGNGGLSDSARHEVEQLLAGDASLAQLKAAADLLRQDMHNRRTAYEAELEGVRTRMSGRLTDKGTAPAEAPAQRAPALSAEDQQAKAWADANPNDPRAAQILASLKAKGL